MLEAITGPGVVCMDTTEDIPEGMPGGWLFPEEEAAVEGVVAARRNEYVTARVCAHRALAGLGLVPQPVLTGPQGEPRWPDGVVGSIAHCAGFRGSALAMAAQVTTIGVDAEPNLPLPHAVLEAVALPAERAWIAQLLRTRPEVCWDRLLFCAKEAVYKAWFPLAGRWLDFEDALVSVDPERETFAAELLVPGPRVHGRRLTGFTGRWTVREGLILAAIVLREPGSREPDSREPGDGAAE